MYNIEDAMKEMQKDRNRAWEIIDTINTIIVEIEKMNSFQLPVSCNEAL